jgi:hypothetical protein
MALIIVKLVGIWLLCFVLSRFLNVVIGGYATIEGLAALATVFWCFAALWWYTP